MQAFVPFFKAILEVLVPFLWDKATEDRTAEVVATDESDARKIKKIREMRDQVGDTDA